MICSKCGNELSENQEVCNNCCEPVVPGKNKSSDIKDENGSESESIVASVSDYLTATQSEDLKSDYKTDAKRKVCNKIFIIFTVLLAAIIGTACFFAGRMTSSTAKEERISTATQEEFLDAMAKGLTARLNYSKSTDTSKMDEKEEYDDKKECINIELNEIGKYENAVFEDETFDKLAKMYIYALKTQLYAVENYRKEVLFLAWEDGYHIRCEVISELYENYNLDITADVAENYLVKHSYEPSYTYSIVPDDENDETADSEEDNEKIRPVTDDETSGEKAFDAEKIAKAIKVKEYNHESDSKYSKKYEIAYVLENTSDFDLDVQIDAFAYDNKGEIIDKDSSSEACLGAGCKYPFHISFDEKPVKYDYKISVSKSNFSSPVKNLKYKTNISGENVIISITNNGDLPVDFAEAYVLFMKDGKMVDLRHTYTTDVDSEIKPGNTEVGKVSCTKDFDDIIVFTMGRCN